MRFEMVQARPGAREPRDRGARFRARAKNRQPIAAKRVQERWFEAMLANLVLSPSRLGPYEIVRPLGAGGMAETFVAVRKGPAGFEQRVCLRRILPVYAEEPKFVEQFLDEARLLAHLHNANIVQVIDFGDVDGMYYMVLELVDGVDLEQLLSASQRAQQRLPDAVACYIGSQLLSALDYAHGLSVNGQPLNLVHRDVSPANVLLSCHGEVKLTDFGIAKSSTRKHKTRTGYTKGKLAYMSPEQVRGDDLDSRSDLFAAGVVLFELLTGRHPFEAETDLAIINNILTSTRPRLAELAPSLPAGLQHVIDLLLAPDRRQRPQTAGDALRLLPYLEPTYVSQRTLSELVSARLATRNARTQARTPESTLPKAAQETEPLKPKTPSRPEVKAASSAATPQPKPVGRRRTGWLLTGALLVGAGGALVSQWPSPRQPGPPALPERGRPAASDASALEPPRREAQAEAPASAPGPSSAGQGESLSDAAVNPSEAPGADSPSSERRKRRAAQKAREETVHSPTDARAKGHSGVSVSADEF